MGAGVRPEGRTGNGEPVAHREVGPGPGRQLRRRLHRET